MEATSGKYLFVLEEILNLYLNDEAGRYAELIEVNMPFIETYWQDHPDQRFTQVLINLGILPNIPGIWYYTEEEEILDFLGIPARDYLLWGQYFDKDGKKLDKPVRKPIKDLDTEHIENILFGEWTTNKEYIKCFEDELKLRGGK